MRRWRTALEWIGGAVLLLLLAAFWLDRRDRAPGGSPMGESVTADEPYYTARIVASSVQLSAATHATLAAQGAKPDVYRRDVHTKAHGCVMASFEIGRVEERFARGLFAAPGKYDAIIRFSSGSPTPQSDSVKDARGMAIKVLHVPGRKLLDFEEDDYTQDFVLMNNPTFFIRTIAEYADFADALGRGQATGYFIGWRNPLTWHLHEMRLAQATFKPRPESLVKTRFWSGSAYTLGPREYVKYSARPCAANQALPPRDGNQEADYLRLELANQAARGGACFDFMVQPQAPGRDMPVEDTTVEWSETDSPFVPVARITLQPAPNDTPAMEQRCESLAFNPWHALPEHRPVGVMNRVREALYQGISQFRRTKNCEPFCRQKCGAGSGGRPCQGGCYKACLASCPLLTDPVAADPALPAGVCEAH